MPTLGFGNESRCFDDLGCFPMEHPWTSNLRPFPQPMKPEEVEVKIYSFTRYDVFLIVFIIHKRVYVQCDRQYYICFFRNKNTRYTVKLWPNILLDESDFDPNRPFTAFIIHGFNSDGDNRWMSDLKDAYLKQVLNKNPNKRYYF